MNLLHPSSVGSPVALWFIGSEPVRMVHGQVRYRVTAAEPTDDGWSLRVKDPTGFGSSFEVSEARGAWELVRAS